VVTFLYGGMTDSGSDGVNKGTKSIMPLRVGTGDETTSLLDREVALLRVCEFIISKNKRPVLINNYLPESLTTSDWKVISSYWSGSLMLYYIELVKLIHLKRLWDNTISKVTLNILVIPRTLNCCSP
jgi:hypothetical protein